MSAARDERIAQLTLAGYTASQISARLHIAPRTVHRGRVRTGIAQPFCGKPLTADERRRAETMLEDGASYSEVARTIGRSRETIRKWFPGSSVWKVGGGTLYRQYMVALDAIVPPMHCEVTS